MGWNGIISFHNDIHACCSKKEKKKKKETPSRFMAASHPSRNEIKTPPSLSRRPLRFHPHLAKPLTIPLLCSGEQKSQQVPIEREKG